MFTYEEKILPLPLELTQSRATSLLFLGLAVGLLGSQEQALSSIAIMWSAGFQLGAVWNPTAHASQQVTPTLTPTPALLQTPTLTRTRTQTPAPTPAATPTPTLTPTLTRCALPGGA